jgi:peptidoglycan/xylan/chitin deacetylase (PgdA/CDA1 family)
MTPDRSSGNFKAFAHLDRPLEDRALLEMSRHGIDIQSHGLTHRFLTELDDHELRREIEEHLRIIESVTGQSGRFMAIPGGDYDGRVRRAVRESGYQAIFCMRKGSAGPNDDLLALPRMVVTRDTTLGEFKTMLSPSGWLRARITSAPQEILSRIFGMRRTDRLRDWLYNSPLAPLLRLTVLLWLMILLVIAGLTVLGMLVIH